MEARDEQNAKTFPAPWSVLLKIISALATVVCLWLVFMHGLSRLNAPLPVLVFSQAGPLALLIGCGLFTVRGYVITPNAILVKRLFWDTQFPRAGLESATFSPDILRGSIRTFGNGGLYSFSGWYRNKELGNYRAFVTDFKKSVVLRYGGKTLVMSPGDPEGFVRELMGAANPNSG